MNKGLIMGLGLGAFLISPSMGGIGGNYTEQKKDSALEISNGDWAKYVQLGRTKYAKEKIITYVGIESKCATLDLNLIMEFKLDDQVLDNKKFSIEIIVCKDGQISTYNQGQELASWDVDRDIDPMHRDPISEIQREEIIGAVGLYLASKL